MRFAFGGLLNLLSCLALLVSGTALRGQGPEVVHTVLGSVQSPEITETSGVVFSRRNPGVVFLHNDSGDSPRIFAIDLEGRHLATIDLSSHIPSVKDPEDLATYTDPSGTHFLFLGDIGDNAQSRSDIVVYRFEEPHVGLNMNNETITVDFVKKIRYTYPDGPLDAEGLVVSPTTGKIFIITKSGPSRIYRGNPFNGPTTLQQIGTLNYGGVTAVAANSDGTEVLLRTYSAVRRHRSPLGLKEALVSSPELLPTVAEPQGEAIDLSADGSTYLTISEGEFPPMNAFLFIHVFENGFESGGLDQWD